MAKDKGQEGLPVNFGKFLAHTDKVVRDRGFKRLKRWLVKHPELERLEYMKVWKGLYFAVWMADKRPVQQELAVNIALLLNDVPQEKRTLWIDTFWETMKVSWEKLDVHRVNKYLLLLRIVLAEVFKDLRTSGWQLQEVKDRAEVLLRPAPHRTNSASSVGIIMQLTRVLWDELLPQLEQSPKASTQAVLALLEPFVGLAEGSYVEGLVRSVHENVFRRVPEDLVKQLKKRLLAAANGAATQKNREALCDTVAELEKRCLDATAVLAPDEANLPSEGAASKEEPSQRSCKKKRKRKVRAAAESQERVNVSPLMLPKAALPLRSKVLAQKKKRQQRLGLGIEKEAAQHDQKAQAQHKSQHEVFPQLASEAARKKKIKRKVSFDLNKNEVVRFSEKTPVSKMKEIPRKKAKRR
ncbi:RRP1B [Symbiodinium sp. CCMP2592]|nr:RRP1B [Symbiodinium sp. CCMP2592]